jgi:hypothetical protein
VLPGAFTVDVGYDGNGGYNAPVWKTQDLIVKNEPVNVAEVVLPLAALSGRIRMEDGSPVPRAENFIEGVLGAVGNPNVTLEIAGDGTFSRFVPANEFRFYLRSLPEEYELRSMRFNDVDLMKETLTVTGKESVNIDIRVAKKVAQASVASTRLTGTVLDSATNKPIAVERLTLCCNATGPAEQYSAPVRADGTFEFSGIPAGRYSPSLQPLPRGTALIAINPTIDVEAQGTSNTTVLATQQFGLVAARFVMADGSPVPDDVRPQVEFGNVSGTRNKAGLYLAYVPLAAEYGATVTGLPASYAVKSDSGTVRPRASMISSTLLWDNLRPEFAPSPITVTLERQ